MIIWFLLNKYISYIILFWYYLKTSLQFIQSCRRHKWTAVSSNRMKNIDFKPSDSDTFGGKTG